MKKINGLVLTGGGARAAYQAGVLKAISNLMPDLSHPFKVIVGTSAGALNAATLASGSDIYRHNIDHLEQLWLDITPDKVYKSGGISIGFSMGRFLQGAISGKGKDSGSALLDNSPLSKFLSGQIDFKKISAAIADDKLRALGINACGYSFGRSLCFYEAKPDVVAWDRGQRLGVPAKIDIRHLMASSAIPTIFPPVRINREFFGDGATRQMAHLSPAIHLGAQKILVIGVSANRVNRGQRRMVTHPPNIGQVMENIMNGIFIDTLEYDIDRVRALNDILSQLPETVRKKLPNDSQIIDLLEISPTRPIYQIAQKYLDRLPSLLRRIMGKNLEIGEGGSSLASYLLFDSDFCSELITLGYSDAMEKASEIEKFFQ